MNSQEVQIGAKVLVTGAGGFVGKAVVRALHEAGYAVRAMTRSAVVFEHAENIVGDMTIASDVAKAVEGMDAVVHLAARKSDERDSEDVNVTGTALLADACVRAGVRRVINISTQSVKLKTLGTYGRTKLASERIMTEAGIPTVTLRPSVVYGDEGGGILTTVLGFCRLPVIPMIGSGSIGFQPIHLDDLAAVIVRSLTKGEAGKTYDVGGTERLTLRELTEDMQKRLGIKKHIFNIPLSVAMLIARLTTWMPKPPVTVSNVLGGSEDVPIDIGPMLRDIGVTPRRFRDGLDAMFAVAEKKQRQAEAKALLQYAYSAWGAFHPTPDDIAKYDEALQRHNMPAHRLDASAVRSTWLLGGLDATAGNASILRQKILIAAAIGECSVQTATLTLPKNRALPSVLLLCAGMVMRSGIKMLLGIMLRLVRPSFTRRNVG